MEDLTKQPCVACRKDARPVTDADIAELHPQVPEWQIVVEDGVRQLVREFRFPNFAQALAFTNAVGQLAEEESHHPRIVTEYGRVEVAWWTHKIGDLHRNDFICAAKTDAAFAFFLATS